MSSNIDELREKIRYATEPDNPQLICFWLKTENDETKSLPLDRQRAVYFEETHLLLDTLSDEIIPSHWRECCLNHIYQPLAYLHRLVRTDQDLDRLNKLMYEVRVTSNFFNPARAYK